MTPRCFLKAIRAAVSLRSPLTNQMPGTVNAIVPLSLLEAVRAVDIPEGGEDEVRLAFTTHDVVVNGSHLDSLLADLSTQKVSLLREPARAERFRHESVDNRCFRPESGVELERES